MALLRDQIEASIKEDHKLVRTSTEVTIHINDIEATALLDSRSCISTISKTFYNEHL